MNPFFKRAAWCSLWAVGAIGLLYGAMYLRGAALLIFAGLIKLYFDRTAALHQAQQDVLKLASAVECERRRATILEMVGTHAPLLGILDAVAELASTAVPGAGAALWAEEHGELRFQTAAKLPRAFVETLAGLTYPSMTAASPVGELAWDRMSARAQEFGLTSLDPMQLSNASGRTIGVVQIFLADGAPRVADRGFIIQMADLAAMAIQNRLRYERVALVVQHDTLTKLPGRPFFQGRLQQAIRLARRDATKLAVVWIDLDRFKQINEMLGHQVSDELLCELAGRLQSCLRQSDAVARIGGDQFTVLVGKVASASEAQFVVERMLSSLGRTVTIRGHDISVTASAGVSVCPDHGEDPGALMRNADLAMYSAKHSGGNTCRVFAPHLGCNMQRRAEIEQELRNALDRAEFSIEYQPLVRRGGQLHGLEALLRWNSAALGCVSPTEFIPIAEEIGLMTAVGEWITRAACCDGARWIRAGHAVPQIAVNASAIQFRDKQFASMVKRALEDFGLSPSKLEIEVTESVFTNDLAQMTDQIELLRELGVTFAIDDFGTGYSGLTRLRVLPVDFVKIDQSFIKDLNAQESASNKIVRGIIELAHSLKLQVIAEGVETEEQLALLDTLGCDISQGFYLYRPMSPALVETILARRSRPYEQDQNPRWLPAPFEIRAS
jgi:diguanylate cyclase (GGDEF)-like protein